MPSITAVEKPAVSFIALVAAFFTQRENRPMRKEAKGPTRSTPRVSDQSIWIMTASCETRMRLSRM